jgi:LmbE family N-acetylglucosaminyl deacetylase
LAATGTWKVERMYSRVILLSPHTDDGELGAGGFISKLADRECEIYHIAFSAAEKSVPECLPEDILRSECKRASAALGIKDGNLFVLNYKVRTFSYCRQDILEDLIKFRNEIKPDLVIAPSSHDVHQDHAVIAGESLRAFKNTTVLAYELPWNNITMNATCFVKLNEGHMEAKVKALECYESQKHKHYFSKDFIYGLARVRGIQAGCYLAEAFEVSRYFIN